jgi:hypothetical protein
VLYELRVYHAAPGKLPALDRRFADHALRLFERHGIRSVGYWTSAEPAGEALTYMLAWADPDERRRLWEAFAADPEWVAAKAESERDGPLVERAEISLLTPTAYSPLR